MLKKAIVNILVLGFCAVTIMASAIALVYPPGASIPHSAESRFQPTTLVSQSDYQNDIDRIRNLGSHPLDELISVSNELESKWRRIDWNYYANVMKYVCREISNRGLNDPRVRENSEHFAMIALSHANMYLWEHESFLVGWLQYERSESSDTAWLRSRRVKAQLWLHAFQRLQRELDQNFDVHDRKNLPSVSVTPPFETGLPPNSPPAAIKDPRLRAKYEAAIAENRRKSEKVKQQIPLRLYGPSFRSRAETWLIQAYSQPPVRNAEISRYLQIYIQDSNTRQKILGEIEKNSR